MRKVLLITLGFLVLLLIALSVPTGYYILSSKNILPSGEGNIVYQTGKNIVGAANDLTGQTFLRGGPTAQEGLTSACLYQKAYQYDSNTNQVRDITEHDEPGSNVQLSSDIIECHESVRPFCEGVLLEIGEICQLAPTSIDIWGNTVPTTDLIGSTRTCIAVVESEGKRVINTRCTSAVPRCSPNFQILSVLNLWPAGTVCYYEAIQPLFDLEINPQVAAVVTTMPTGGTSLILPLAGLLAAMIPALTCTQDLDCGAAIADEVDRLLRLRSHPDVAPQTQPEPEGAPRQVPLPCIPFINCPLPQGAPPEDPVCPQGTIREGDFCLDPQTREAMARVITASSIASSAVVAAMSSVSIPATRSIDPLPVVVELYETMKRKITQTRTQDKDRRECSYYDGNTTQTAPILAQYSYPFTTNSGLVKKSHVYLASRQPIPPGPSAYLAKKVLQDFITFAQTDWVPTEFCFVIAPLYNKNIGASFSSANYPKSIAINDEVLLSRPQVGIRSMFHEFVHFYDNDYLHSPYYQNANPLGGAFSEGRAYLGEFLSSGGQGLEFAGVDQSSRTTIAQLADAHYYGWQNLTKPNLSNYLHQHPPEPTREYGSIFLLMTLGIDIRDKNGVLLKSNYEYPLTDAELSDLFKKLITNNGTAMYPQQEGPSLAEAPNIDTYGILKNAPPNETATTNDFSTKACVYSQLDNGIENCYWGNCKDSSKNCGSFVNDNCTYIPDKSTGEKLSSCPIGDTSNLTPSSGTGANQEFSDDIPCIYQEKEGDNNSCFVGRLDEFGKCVYVQYVTATEEGKHPSCSPNPNVCIYPQKEKDAEGNEVTNCYYGRCTSSNCTAYSFNIDCSYDSDLGQPATCPSGSQAGGNAPLTSSYTCASTNLSYINIGIGDSTGKNIQNFKTLNCAQNQVQFDSSGNIKTTYDIPNELKVAGQIYTIVASFHYQDGSVKDALSRVMYKPSNNGTRR